jgi:hypothetical protein
VAVYVSYCNSTDSRDGMMELFELSIGIWPSL